MVVANGFVLVCNGWLDVEEYHQYLIQSSGQASWVNDSSPTVSLKGISHNQPLKIEVINRANTKQLLVQAEALLQQVHQSNRRNCHLPPSKLPSFHSPFVNQKRDLAP